MDQSKIQANHAVILAEQAIFQARQTEKLDEIMNLIISRFGVIEDHTEMPETSQVTSACHIPYSSSMTQS